MSEVPSKGLSNGGSHAPGQLYRERVFKATERLERLIDVDFHANPFRLIGNRFAIAHTPRTGSYLLCEHLRNHGAVVREYFHPNRVAKAKEIYDVSTLQAFCKKTIVEFMVRNTFGAKGAFDVLAPLVLAGEFPDYRAEWKFVYLTRSDMVMQAVSQFKAELTGSWVSSAQPKRELTHADFNPKRISGIIRDNRRSQDTWEDTFALFGIEPMRLSYEEIAADPGAAAAKTAEFLHLDGRPITDSRFQAPAREKQATKLNENWAVRFRELDLS